MPRALSLGLSFFIRIPVIILFTAKNSSGILFNTLDIEKISSEQLKSTSKHIFSTSNTEKTGSRQLKSTSGGIKRYLGDTKKYLKACF